MPTLSTLVATHPDTPLTVPLPDPRIRHDAGDDPTRATGTGTREKKTFEGPVEKLVDALDKFTVIVSRQLPDDVRRRLKELAEDENQPMARMIYETMERNQSLAAELKRPSCQDTGLVQVFIRCGTNFPHMNQLSDAVREGVQRATWNAPLRLNSVETFDEYNTGTNTGTRSPWTYWQNIPDWDGVEMDVYLAGGGCSLPGQGKTLMPGEGYEAAMEFVLDVMTSYGLNACPPLLVGVGLGSSIDAAAFQSKLALMRPVDSHSANPLVARLEDDRFVPIRSSPSAGVVDGVQTKHPRRRNPLSVGLVEEDGDVVITITHTPGQGLHHPVRFDLDA